MLANQASNWMCGGRTPKRMGNAHVNIVPYQVFATADGHVVLAVGNDAQFARFCELAGRPDVDSTPRYLDNAQRLAHRDELVGLIAGWMKERTTAGWIALLEPNAVPCAPILEVPQVFAHRQVVHRGMRVERDGVPMVATPMRFDGERPVAPLRPPQLDEHGEAIRKALARGERWPAPDRAADEIGISRCRTHLFDVRMGGRLRDTANSVSVLATNGRRRVLVSSARQTLAGACNTGGGVPARSGQLTMPRTAPLGSTGSAWGVS